MAPKTRRPLGVILDLPNAPLTPHTISGIDGEYHPAVPTPLDECPFTLEQAQAWHGDPAFPLAVVELNGDGTFTRLDASVAVEPAQADTAVTVEPGTAPADL